MKGNIIRLNTLHLNSASMNGVREVQGSSASGGGGIVPNPYIQFADAEVERILMANGVSSDGIGITIEDAEKVTSIERWFKGTAIGSFDEFKFFKGVSSVLGGYQNGAFYNCTNLKTISIPENCKELQYYAFQKCTALESVTGLENAETMGLAVFDSCYALAINELRMPNLKGTLRANVFTACTMTRVEDLGQITHIADTGYNKGIFPKMTEFLRLPATLVDISNYAFQINTNLQTIICEAVNPPTAAAGIFNGSNCPIYVPDASLEAYKTATNWNAYADRIHPLSEIEGSLVFYDKLVGDGTAYINTELLPNSFDNYEWKADPPMYVNKFIFGAKSTNQSALALVYSEGESYYLYTGHGQDPIQVLQENYDFMHRALRLYQRQSDGIWVRELCNFVTGNIKILGEGGDTENEYIGTLPLLLFACNKSTTNAAADRIYRGAILSFIVTDSRTNEVRMSLKPCTWNGEAGMWDEVGNKFYGNADTSGEFSVAND
jgi:hypothetical protein